VSLQLISVTQYNVSCKAFDLSDSLLNNVDSKIVNVDFSEHKTYFSLDLSLPNQYAYVPEYFLLTIMKSKCSGMFFTTNDFTNVHERCECKVLFVFVNKPKALVAREGYRVIISSNILLNGMIKRLEGIMGNCSGGGEKQ
jgi:hypothetical protein